METKKRDNKVIKKEETYSNPITDEEDKKIKRYISKITTPIFNKALKEKKISEPNTMAVSVKPLRFAWRPNNYRLGIPFNLETFKPTLHRKHYIPKRRGEYIQISGINVKISNFFTKFTIKNFEGVTIEVNKNIIIGIYSLRKEGKRAYFSIEGNSFKECEEQIDRKRKQIKQICISKIKKIIGVLGGIAEYNKAKWIRKCTDEGLKGDKFLDDLPSDLRLDDTYIKKVYDDEVEFKGITHLKTYISNRAIENVTPEIAKEIKLVRNTMREIYKDVGAMVTGMRPTLMQITNLNKGFTDLNVRLSQLEQSRETQTNLDYLMSNIKTVEDIFTYKQRIVTLSKGDKKKLENHIINLN